MPYTPYATSDYANLGAAIADIGANPATLYIDSAIDLTANATVPSTLSIIDTREGYIVQTAAFTLTINGPFEAAGKAFSGFAVGQVTFGTGYVWDIVSEWWGAVGDGATDDAVAIESALESLPGGNLRLGPRTYILGTISSGAGNNAVYLIPKSNVNILGYGGLSTLKVKVGMS
jgi:polygalacturonase